MWTFLMLVLGIVAVGIILYGMLFLGALTKDESERLGGMSRPQDTKKQRKTKSEQND
ncbi:hypothetical protein [Chrysiogenes arsenatis]|uniref:hypothetical protein n=1 Tax=Chrysiogenes arsenatis TaxID=309797 RepID=UPI00041F6A56|nr:hypothetical protein [Chrysiogenes arsenatis]